MPGCCCGCGIPCCGMPGGGCIGGPIPGCVGPTAFLRRMNTTIAPITPIEISATAIPMPAPLPPPPPPPMPPLLLALAVLLERARLLHHARRLGVRREQRHHLFHVDDRVVEVAVPHVVEA